MYVQYSPALPGICEDDLHQKVHFRTDQDLSDALEAFYTSVIADDVDAFALRAGHAQGFFAMLETLRNTGGAWAKGQVTGPISFGLTVTDQDLRASFYAEVLVDVVIKNAAMNARWQIRQLKSTRPNVIIFLDEPYLAGLGSAFISLNREQVISSLDEVFSAIHAEGGLAGIHCCANTDWAVLLASQVDILNLDAYGYVENLALYPADLRDFLDRGGCICWGIIPNNEAILEETAAALADRLRAGMGLIVERASLRGIRISTEDLMSRSLLSPACGLGSASIEVADQALKTLAQTAAILKRG
jgi:methionine synthase II (cobalamin-independent)